MEKFKLLVAGGRDFDNFLLLEEKLDFLLKAKAKTHSIVIISGCARGVDSLAIVYAENKGYETLKYPADWDKYGKRAGYLRNVEMGMKADACVLFWDGQSKGTGHMKKIIEDLKKPLRVIEYLRSL